MALVSRQCADMLLSNFCHLDQKERKDIIDRINDYTFEGITYAFPPSKTDSRNVFHDLMELYVAMKERGRGSLKIGLTNNDLVGYSYGIVYINSDITNYRMQVSDPTLNVPDRVDSFYKLPFTLESVKMNLSRYFFSERIQAFGKFIWDFLCRYDEYTTWNKKVRDKNYRNDVSFRKQIDVLCSPDALVSQQVSAAYNIFTWAGIDITDELTRTCEPWRTLRADSDALEMIQSIVDDASVNKGDPFRNPVLPGVTADMNVEPEYDVEITKEDWLAEVVTKSLAAKALCAYNKSIDWNVLVKVYDSEIAFSVNHEMLAQHIYQYRGRHEIRLIPVTLGANGKVSWRYILEDQDKKSYVLFSNISKNKEVYGLYVNQDDPNQMELLVIEKDKHSRYTFTG